MRQLVSMKKIKTWSVLLVTIFFSSVSIATFGANTSSPVAADAKGQLQNYVKTSIAKSLSSGLWITHDSAWGNMRYAYDPKRPSASRLGFQISQFRPDPKDSAKQKLFLVGQGTFSPTNERVSGYSKTKGYWVLFDINKCLSNANSKVSLDSSSNAAHLECPGAFIADLRFENSGLITSVISISTSTTSQTNNYPQVLAYTIRYWLPKEAAAIYVYKKGSF
jgi:hypothetical protein